MEVKIVEVVEESDHLLVQKSKQADKQAFSELVKRYEKKIFSLIYSLLSNQQDAEDLTQEVFVRAYFSLNSYRQESKFYTWLYRIAYNMSIDFKRRVSNRIREVTTINDDLQDQLNFIEDKNVIPADELIENRELSLSLKQALSEISEEHRAVMILREVDGLSYDEIAKITGSARGTVMSRLHYARRHLQKVLINSGSGSAEERRAEEGSAERNNISISQTPKTHKIASDGGLVDILLVVKMLVVSFFVYLSLSIFMHNLSLHLAFCLVGIMSLLQLSRFERVRILKLKGISK